MSTTNTTIPKNSKRGSDVLSDTSPDILNATTRPSMDTHKKRRLDDADSTTPTVKPRAIATSIASKTHESQGHTPAGSSTQRQSTSTPHKDVHTHRSETLISTRRVGPSVVVRRYEVIVSRPKARQATIHTRHSHTRTPKSEPRTPHSKPRMSSASTTSARPTSTSSGPEASKSHATEPKRNAKASSQQSVATDAMNNAKAPRPNLQPRKEKNAGGSRSKPAGGKDKPRRVPARALAVASKLSAQEVERLMAKVGMEGYKMPPTLARLPSFRKKKAEV